MGQTTTGILFGVASRAPDTLDDEEGWAYFLEVYKTDGPDPDYHYDDLGTGEQLVGFWVAVGASGRDGVPDLDTPIPLDNIAATEPYASAIQRARDEWRPFAAWMRATHCIEFGVPTLWILQTEVG